MAIAPAIWYNGFIDSNGFAVRMKPLISGGLAPPIEWFIDCNGVAVRMKPLIYGG